MVLLEQGLEAGVDWLTKVPESWWKSGRQEAKGMAYEDSRGIPFAASLVHEAL